MATTNDIHSVTVALRAGVSEATLPDNRKMQSGKSYVISLEDWGKISGSARETVVAEPTFNVKPWIVPLYNGTDYLLDLDQINNKTTIALINADDQADFGVAGRVGGYYLGQVVRGFKDAAFKLVEVTSGSATVAVGSVVVWGGNSTATTSAAAKAASLVTSDVSDVTDKVFAGVAIGTITAGSFGWIQVSGVATAKVHANTDAGDTLKVSTTDETLTGVENEVVTVTFTSYGAADAIDMVWDGNSEAGIVASAAAGVTLAALQAAADSLGAQSTTQINTGTTYTAGDIVVTQTTLNVEYVFTFSGASVKNRDVSAITWANGTGGSSGSSAVTNAGSGDTATGEVVATARSAADTGTALAEVRSSLARNLRSRERDIFRATRN